MRGPVFILGAGAVGTSLGSALAEAGVLISGAYCRDPDHAYRAAGAIGTTAHSGELPAALGGADVVLVAVPDPAIATVADRALAAELADEKQIWLHCAGGLPAAALAPLAGHVEGIGTMHPALTFPGGERTAVPRGATFAIDGDPSALEVARDLVAALGGVAVEIPPERRAAYHASLVLASNYLVAQLAQARELLGEIGLSGDEAEKLLTSLGASALAGAANVGIDASLTGPISRGDAEAVARHLEALRASPAAVRLYRELGRATLQMVRERRELSAVELTALAEMLETVDDDGE
jgi:predicted short-subunit dehydrogenase-like oxidoreductase (DUF2520 family)